jgi:hypothetical protein
MLTKEEFINDLVTQRYSIFSLIPYKNKNKVDRFLNELNDKYNDNFRIISIYDILYEIYKLLHTKFSNNPLEFKKIYKLCKSELFSDLHNHYGNPFFSNYIITPTSYFLVNDLLFEKIIHIINQAFETLEKNPFYSVNDYTFIYELKKAIVNHLFFFIPILRATSTKTFIYSQSKMFEVHLSRNENWHEPFEIRYLYFKKLIDDKIIDKLHNKLFFIFNTIENYLETFEYINIEYQFDIYKFSTVYFNQFQDIEKALNVILDTLNNIHLVIYFIYEDLIFHVNILRYKHNHVFSVEIHAHPLDVKKFHKSKIEKLITKVFMPIHTIIKNKIKMKIYSHVNRNINTYKNFLFTIKYEFVRDKSFAQSNKTEIESIIDEILFWANKLKNLQSFNTNILKLVKI